MPAQPSPAKVLKAQKIAVVNHGAYTMYFHACYKNEKKEDKELPPTDTYPVGQVRVVDLSSAPGITTGCKIWPRMQATAGGSSSGTEVEYAPNGHTVTYYAKGTTYIGRALELQG